MCLAIYTFPLGIDGFFYLLFFDYFRYHPFLLNALFSAEVGGIFFYMCSVFGHLSLFPWDNI